MARYHIKQPPDSREPYPPEEYWRETQPGQERDLDFDEIDELNRLAEQDDELVPIRPLRKPWVQALIALALIAAFILWISMDMFSGSFDWGFLRRSAQLSEDAALVSLRESVVTVEGSGGNGSGFNIRPDGLIVTNLHVVQGSGIITVTFPDGAAFTTRSYTAVADLDMALLDIDGQGLPAVELSAAYPAGGEELIFIGNPLGVDWTISEATVQGMVLLEGQADETPMIWFDGPVQPGSSGSPLFNSNSQVVGVVFARLTDRENSGLAIPIEALISFLEE